MENSQRNVSSPIAGDPPQRWTLMFIGDKGQVVTIRRFKGVAVTVTVLVVVLALVSASLFFFYRRPANENAVLKAQLVRSADTITELTLEKDRLTAQLVLIKTKLNTASSAPEQAALPETPPETTSAASAPGPAASNGEASSPKAPESPPKMIMAAEDLKTVRDSRDDALRIRFTLKNKNDAIKPARGRTFVILDPQDGSSEHYLSYPRTSLVNGKPESWRKGRYFSINRFNIIRFKTTETLDHSRYAEARVLVYSRTGELILEKHFPVSIPEPKPKSPPITDGTPPPVPAETSEMPSATVPSPTPVVVETPPPTAIVVETPRPAMAAEAEKPITTPQGASQPAAQAEPDGSTTPAAVAPDNPPAEPPVEETVADPLPVNSRP